MLRGVVTAIILVVLMAASLGAGYLAGSGSQRTETLTLTSAITSRQTVVVTTTVENTATSTQTAGSPIPVASVETADISIGGSPRTIAVNPNANRIYVADWSSKDLTVIDALSHMVIATVTLPASSNNGIAIDYNTNVVYVLVQGGVAEVNGSTNKVVGELSLDFGAGALAYDSAKRIIYGSGPGQMANGSTSGGLLGVDVRTGSVVANISLGYWANGLAIDPYTHTIYPVGCAGSFVCGSEVSIVNGTSGTLLTTVHLGSAYYPRVTMDPKTNVVYASGEAQLVALNGTNGKIIYDSNPQTCGPFDSMAVIPSSNQVLAVSLNYDYLQVYEGATGALVNMYSFPSTPQYVAFNPDTNELYVTLSGQLLTFHNVASTGNVNSTLVGSGQNCLPV